jgi:starch synthase (maltosyl-transferring)
VNDAIEGKEEYLHSEKYEIKDWNRDEPGNIKGVLKRLNTIRQENPALQQNWNLQFYKVNNDHILCYGKFTDDLENMIFVAVSLDPYHTREGKVWLPLEDLNIPKDQAYMVHELFSDEKFIWQGEDNYIKLDPKETPAKVFSIRRRLRRENDFDYFM